MSRIKLLLNVLNDIRSLADSLEEMANAMADGDNQAPEREAEQTPAKETSPSKEANTAEETKTTVTHEMLRELAVKLSRSDKREEVKQLIVKYGVKNITAVAESDLDAFYNDLKLMEDDNRAAD